MEPTLLQGLYCGPAPDPATLWNRWNMDPLLLLALGMLALSVRRSPTGLGGVVVLAVAFVSPLCALSAALFSARVLHHLALVAVAAPLLGHAQMRARLAGGVSLPVAFLLQALALWVWHLPAAYDAAMGHMGLYWVMQGTLLGPAVLFWMRVLDPAQSTGRAGIGLVATYVQMALLGALLTFAPVPLYAIHAVAPLQFGLTPLADQQLGGLIMWVPACLPYLVAGALIARRGWARLGVLA